MDRLPWWRRSLRKEVAVLELSDAELQTTFCAADSESKFEFTCRNAHGLFQESADKPLTSFIRITTEDASMQEEAQGFNWPRYENFFLLFGSFDVTQMPVDTALVLRLVS